MSDGLAWDFARDDDVTVQSIASIEGVWHILPAQEFRHVPSTRCLCDPVPCCGIADVFIHKDMRRRP